MATEVFKPIFIVGYARSGTTLLATLLDRNSKIAISPETHFFRCVLNYSNPNKMHSHEYLMKKLFDYPRTHDLNLDRDDVLKAFKVYPPNFRHLFQSLLEVYAQKEGKKRPGEKTPSHMVYVPQILSMYPEAKIICIIRDGRAVVNSVMNMPWNQFKNIAKHCAEWNYHSTLTIKYLKKKPDSFMVVKYEDLVTSPEAELTRICDFIGEEYEQSQLIPKESKVVPSWEKDWKKSAVGELNSDRIHAWKDMVSNEDRALIEVIMEKSLIYWGYKCKVDRRNLSTSSLKQSRLYGDWYYPVRRAYGQFKWKLMSRAGLVRQY
jgi:hypothetical protein